MKKYFIVLCLLIAILSACATVENTAYKPDKDGWYVLNDMTEMQLQKLADEFGLTLEELLEAQKDNSKFIRRKHTTQEGDEVWLNTFETHINDSYFDIVHGCYRSIPESDASIVISPNPASSFVNINLLTQYQSELPSHPVIVELQLLWEQRTVKQWIINEYQGETIKMSDSDLPGNGTYMMAVTFASRQDPNMKIPMSKSFLVNKNG